MIASLITSDSFSIISCALAHHLHLPLVEVSIVISGFMNIVTLHCCMCHTWCIYKSVKVAVSGDIQTPASCELYKYLLYKHLLLCCVYITCSVLLCR
ncbi:hypothetical protein EB796_001972 [Bugula neritina]|uniref:Uncharacterized protein n=1 Tax=Bugula neritina TaxID=10212 RepID=A0A7J7KNG9_BUGNE|nr:hypothetical protein EB796_001972 [Bugula neritina]